MLDFFQGWLPQWLIDVVSSLSFLSNYEAISKGVLDLRTVIYFILVIAFWLYASAVVIDAKKAS